MISLSLGLILWHSVGMNKIYQIDQNDLVSYSAFSDNSHGGQSLISYDWKNGTPSFNCLIDKIYAWPYCEISFQVRPFENPLNLARYEFVRVNIKSIGEGPQNIKIYLRNFNPDYSSQEKTNSLKLHQLQFDPNDENNPFDVPLTAFVVPQWWLSEMKLSPLQASQELENILFIEVATGDNRTPGEHHVVIQSIEFHGKWISYAQLISIILASWFCFALFILINGTLQARVKISSERRTKEALQDINKALSLEKIELEEQAKRDHLTGALNRFGLRQHLLEAVRAVEIQQSELSVIMMDIDHFKQINDSFGHDIGDHVLCHFSKLIHGSIRESDSFGRWGGEEFILICPSSRLEQSSKQAENLRLQLEKSDWPEKIKVSSSFGVAQMKTGENISDTIKRADLALYQAKSLGRNRVEQID